MAPLILNDRPQSVVTEMMSDSDLANLQVNSNAQSNFTQGGQQQRYMNQGQRRT